MKKTFFYAASIAFITLGMTACGASTEENKEDTATTYELDSKATTLKWKGTYAADGHTHNGTVDISSGSITYKGETFEAGNFTVDMKTIKNELTPEMGSEDLNSSIMGEGLFNASQFPNVDVVINSISDKEIDATLKVAGKEVPAKMPVTVKRTDKELTAKGKFTVDFSPMDAEGFKPGTEKGKETQYIKPGVDFELNLVMKAK
ncbi:YceI family protein [Fluviicola sp.]|uniref:YceI family protein n=1 Tax=Fluviicola sp. TaxID=1917219 RepID=UPI0031D48A91